MRKCTTTNMKQHHQTNKTSLYLRNLQQGYPIFRITKACISPIRSGILSLNLLPTSDLNENTYFPSLSILHVNHFEYNNGKTTIN